VVQAEKKRKEKGKKMYHVAHHEDDGTEREYWFVQDDSAVGIDSIMECFDTEAECIAAVDRLNKNQINLSKMDVGDMCIHNDQVCALRNQGRQGGCNNDLWLALVCDEGDDEQINRLGIDVDNLPELIVDCDNVSGVDDIE